MTAVPPVLSVTAKRLIVYTVYDKDGQVDAFIPHALRALRRHADHILVVVNGRVNAAGRALLGACADEVLVRENVGFDIGAHRAALDHMGKALDGFDEVVLTNDTWYGPVRPWGPVLERMGGTPCHFWGLTDHAASTANPFTTRGIAPYHLQSYWIAVRREMFSSRMWREYWADLPAIDTYIDAVVGHELRFTEHFTSAGWVAEAAFPVSNFDTENPSLFEAESLITEGCPVLKRRPFFHWPPLLDEYGAVGAWTMAAATAEGYPSDLILSNLARTVPPKAMNVDVGLLSVLPRVCREGEADRHEDDPSVLVVVHSDGDRIDEALRRAQFLPWGFDLVVTTDDRDAARSLEAQLSALGVSERRTEVRVVPASANATSAFLVGCRDVLLSGEYEIVVRLSAVDLDRDDAQRQRAEHAYGNLLPDGLYAESLLGLFRDEATLGIAYPPLRHIGHATLGRSWESLRPVFARAAREIGVTVPLDDVSALAPADGMFVARTAALRLLSESPWTYDDFLHTDGLPAAVERMWSYAAGQLGYHTRTVATRGYLAMSHAVLEYELDAMAATIPGDFFEKIDFLRESGWVGEGSGSDLLRMYARRRNPWLVHLLRRLADPARLPARLLRRGDR